MVDDRINEPEGSEPLPSDPPNNTEAGANLSPMDSEAPAPSDPPNNT
jgi:hypothetical protein